MIAQRLFTLGFISAIFSWGAHASDLNISGGNITASSYGQGQTTQITSITGIGTFSASSSSYGYWYDGASQTPGGSVTNNTTVTASLSDTLINISMTSHGGQGLASNGDVVAGQTSGVIDFSLANASSISLGFDGGDWAYGTITGPSGLELDCYWNTSVCKGAMAFEAGNYEISFTARDLLFGGIHADTYLNMSLSLDSPTLKIETVPLPGAAWFFGAALLSITGAVRPRQRWGQ